MAFLFTPCYLDYLKISRIFALLLKTQIKSMLDFNSFPQIVTSSINREILEDLWVALVSREASIVGRKEVLSGKAKFGILGDGKEVAQLAMSKAFQKGDFRAGYYRDQTFMFHKGLYTINDFFAQLYADSDRDPFSKGRQMNNHFATPLIDDKGKWTNHTERYNISSDISPTAGQMPRAFGLALASKKYKAIAGIENSENFSKNGNEVCFCTIGDASTSEGPFWETMNATAVKEVPLAVIVWDDGFGISVPKSRQTTKGCISEALAGFKKEENTNGIYIYQVKAGNYPELIKTFDEAIGKCRNEHVPVLIHVIDVTQPLGHSTSGSHERYKTKERLKWEKDNDPIDLFIKWIKENNHADDSTIQTLKDKAKEYVNIKKKESWKNLTTDIKTEITKLDKIYSNLTIEFSNDIKLRELNKELKATTNPMYHDVVRNARKLNIHLAGKKSKNIDSLKEFISKNYDKAEQKYHTDLYSASDKSALKVKEVKKVFSENSSTIPGYKILNKFFDKKFSEDKRLIAFGEDVGMIGDVNQGFAGLQEKYGDERVFDTGIREWTIMGQAIGLAMRGFRPITEIQYLDYLIYGHSPLSDDLATLRYRSGGQQMAPAIIRTRGHRLEGIWHAGSPLGMLINSLRGMYILLPRDMVQAAGMYNTMLKSDDPALIIECLNGYRLREKMPDNVGEYTVPIGVPEILKQGNDITLVTYGSMVNIADKAIKILNEKNISIELIDAQTLLPFDINHVILESVKKTNKLVIIDEDVPGGASAYMLEKITEEQGAFDYLDHAPITITSKSHRPPYGSDGDYFTKPNVEDIVEKVYNLMSEYNPGKYPGLV